MPKLRIKKGDEVIVLTGKDKGKKGEILKSFPDDNKVLVAGVNQVKKHNKPSGMSAGGITTIEKPIHVSNVALVDPKEGVATRVTYKTLDNGDKVRVAKKSGETIAN